jgi:hypothetical protein
MSQSTRLLILIGLCAGISGAGFVAAAEAKPRPHLIVHPKRLKPGERFEVRGFGFPPGEELAIAECSNRLSFGFPLECAGEEAFAVATPESDGSFSATMHAETCPVGEAGRARRWCYVGILTGSGEDTFELKPTAVISVR